MKRIYTLTFILFAIVSCRHESPVPEVIPNEDNHFYFGKRYGFCHGKCGKYYALTPTALYPDDSMKFNDPWKFKKTSLSIAKFEAARPLLDSFPSYFLRTNDTVFGCPDCADQGTILLQVKQGNLIKNCYIDPYTNQLPQEIRFYAKKLNAVLYKLDTIQ